jgi:DNA topoisomerase-1
LGIKPHLASRIAFNEITKSAVNQALKEPRAIDMSLVNAQQARRILDRLVGYKLSPVVSKKIKPKLSAGRVQSVTLKLVVIREREIQNFKPEEYWDFGARLEKDKIDFLAALITDQNGKKLKLTNQVQVAGVIADLDGAKYIVSAVRKSITRSHAPAPYTTSSMQQDALNRAGLSLKRCGMAAQDLYQGINLGEQGMTALVTYIRTDSVRVSSEAQIAAKAYITNKFGADYAPPNFNFYKSKKSAQDAHEAIRPTNIELTPQSVAAYLSPDQLKLYTLIYNRFLASQMSEATFNSVSVDIAANKYGFRVTGKTPIFAGWQAAYANKVEEEKEENDEKDNDEGSTTARLPELNEGDILKFLKLEFAQKFTKPPARYTEATLVKAMEEKGIGRPATYNPIIQNIINRFYIEKDGKVLKPTDLGFKVVDFLEKYFEEIMNIQFTANMEDSLDDIAYEGLAWQGVIDEFYKPFLKKLEFAMDGDDQSFKMALEETDIPCGKCGRLLVVRMGRFGKFLACPGFPECRNILPYAKPICKCPYCPTGDIYPRKSKKGRMFFGCSSYPNCTFVTWDSPTGELCAKCNQPMIVKESKSEEKTIMCSNRECN